MHQPPPGRHGGRARLAGEGVGFTVVQSSIRSPALRPALALAAQTAGAGAGRSGRGGRWGTGRRSGGFPGGEPVASHAPATLHDGSACPASSRACSPASACRPQSRWLPGCKQVSMLSLLQTSTFMEQLTCGGIVQVYDSGQIREAMTTLHEVYRTIVYRFVGAQMHQRLEGHEKAQ